MTPLVVYDLWTFPDLSRLWNTQEPYSYNSYY